MWHISSSMLDSHCPLVNHFPAAAGLLWGHCFHVSAQSAMGGGQVTRDRCDTKSCAHLDYLPDSVDSFLCWVAISSWCRKERRKVLSQRKSQVSGWKFLTVGLVIAVTGLFVHAQLLYWSHSALPLSTLPTGNPAGVYIYSDLNRVNGGRKNRKRRDDEVMMKWWWGGRVHCSAWLV